MDLVRQLQIVAGPLAVALIGVLLWGTWVWWDAAVLTVTVKTVAGGLFFAVLLLLGLATAAKTFRYRKTAIEILIGLGTATIGFLLARVHLNIFF